MIIFKKIKWKNFLSTGNQFLEVNLNKTQTTLIIGTNGSGKSTLLDAICFVLFNRPFRQIKKEQMVNTINNGDTVVEIDFSIGKKQYKVTRGIKPNIFEIYCDDILLNQEASSVDYQKVLERNIMKLSYRSFVQVVILGSSSYEPFMKLRARYRKEAVEEILDIKVFSHMNLMLKEQQGQLSKQIDTAKFNVELLRKEHEIELGHYNQILNSNTDDKTNKENELQLHKQKTKEYLEKRQQLNDEYKQQETELEGKDKIETKLRQLQKIETKIEQNLETHKKNLNFFQENDSCPTCTQKIDEQFREEKIKLTDNKIQTLNDGMKDLVGEISNTEEKLTSMNKVSKKLYDLTIETSKLNTSIDELKKYTDKLHTELLTLDNKEDDLKGMKIKLDELNKQIGLKDSELSDIISQKKYVDIVREILSERGARTRIIKKYLPIMNTLINKYLQAMDFYISFHLDEEFNETVKSRHRDTFDYNCFSEGEKMRIDLALLFTWRQVARMKNSTNTNLLILDEIFDSSLDGQGTEDFFKLMNTMSKENVFIISHKGDILFDKFTNIIKFEKQNNFTRLQQV